MNKLTIRTTLLLVVGIFVLMLVCGSAVGYFAVRSGNEAIEAMASNGSQIAHLLSGSDQAAMNTQLANQLSAAHTRMTTLDTMIVVALAAACGFGLFALWVMRRQVIQPLDEATGHFHRIASGDLSRQVEVNSDNEMGRVFAGINAMQQGLAATLQSVRSSAGSIDVGAREIAAGNTDLSARTEQQASSLQQTAASMEQLTATVRQNTDNARQASQLAATASQIASRGGEVVGDVVETMQGIATSSDKIADIIGVIEGIAFQTNILALNAAVEAARAGEQGRGFAVVAGEVRTLAQRSAAAAKEIKGLIGDSAEKVHSGTALVARAGETMSEIVQAVKRVTDIMGEISSASEEQKGGIEQVNQAVNQMDQVTQQNAALVEEAAAAAASLEEQTRQLSDALTAYRFDDRFDDRSDAADAAKRGPTATPVAAVMPARAVSAVTSAPRTLSSNVSSNIRVQAAKKAKGKPISAVKSVMGKVSAGGQNDIVLKTSAMSAQTTVVKAAKPAVAATPRPAKAASAPTTSFKSSAASEGEWETF